MGDFWVRLFDTSDFPARWNCGQWDEGLGWLHIVSDLGVWSAYLAIPIALVLFARRKKDVPFRNLFWLFSSFILLCGTTHLIEAAIFWWPVYRFAGLVKLITAVVSWTTVLSLLPVIPKAFAMRFPEELEREVAERRRVEAELRASEERFRVVIESAPDAIVTTNRAGRIVGWSRAAEQMFGYAAAEVEGRDIACVLPRGADFHHDTPSGTGDRVVASEGRRRDSGTFPAELTGTSWGAGGETYFTTIVRDATERTRALEAVVRSERYYRTLFENAHDPILVFEPNGGRVLDVNAEACHVYGFTRDEFLRRSLADLSADRDGGRKNVARVTDGRDSYRFETVQLRRDGRRMDLEVNASVVECDGRPAVLSINRDVTARKQADRCTALQSTVSQVLAEATSLPGGAADVLRAVCEANDWSVGEFWVFSPDEGVLRPAATWNVPAAAAFVDANRDVSFPPGVGLPGRALATGQPESVPDLTAVDHVPRAAAALACGMSSALSLPARTEGRVVGVFVFFHAAAEPTPADWDLLLGLSHQMALFTERKRAKLALLGRTQAASARAKVAAAVATSGETRAVLRECCEGLAGELGTAFVRVWTIAESEPVLELQASAGMYTHTDGPHARVPVGRFKIGWIAEQRRPHVTNAAADDPLVGDKEWAKREGLTAFAGYPLLLEGRLVGVLATFSRGPIEQAACDALAAAADLMAQFVERRRAEEAMRLRDRAIASFVQGVAIADATHPDRPLVYVNPGFERMTGYAAAEAVGRNCRFLQGKDTDPAAVGQIRTAMRDGRPAMVELLNYRKDGTSFWNALSVVPLRDGAGRVTHFVGVQTDVTPFKNLESQLVQSQKMEAVGHLAGGVAHDFNNLLTVINGYAEMAIRELPPGAAVSDLLAEVLASGHRAADLTRQLLAFSRQQVLQPRLVELNSLAAGVQKMLARVIGEDVQLATVLHPGVGTVLVDPGQMEQVLLNLAVNARDAMPTGGRLTVETMPAVLDEAYAAGRPEVQPGRYAMLAVTDTGCGMSEEVQARIFEPFFTTKEVGKGTGLGLATVFGIVKQSGGHVAVYSEVGRGTSFKVYLPEARPANAAVGTDVPTPPPTGRETVLLVEDENKVRALAGTALRRAGYTVLEASGADDAARIVAARGRPVDLLLTDVVMPGKSGRVLAEELTAAYPGLRVLFMSGYTDDAVVRHGLLYAEVEFLQKPFTIDALMRKVRDVLDRPAPRPPARATV